MQHAVADKCAHCHEALRYKSQIASHNVEAATWDSPASNDSDQSNDDD